MTLPPTPTPPLKILFLNPIGNTTVNTTFASMTQHHKSPSTRVTVASLHPRAGNIGGFSHPPTETLLNAEIVRATYQARRENYDALVINIFRDAVLNTIRQIAGDMVIIGPCQSSTETALRLSNRYSIIVNNETYVSPIQHALRYWSPAYQPVSFRYVDMAREKDLAKVEEGLLGRAREAVEVDGAEAVVIGCTLAVEVHERIQREIGVPVIDGGIAALKTAELAAWMRRECGWGTSNRGMMLSRTHEELGEMGFLQEEYEFSARVEVE